LACHSDVIEHLGNHEARRLLHLYNDRLISEQTFALVEKRECCCGNAQHD
jgi:hypothetical protein